jgi:hypothetical protein
LQVTRGMLDRPQALPMIVMGTVLTKACATFGLIWLLSLATGPSGQPAKPMVPSLSIPIAHRDVNEMVGLARALRARDGRVTASASGGTLRMTGRPYELGRLARIVRAIDRPENQRQRIWTLGACDLPINGPLPPGARVTQIIRDQRHDVLIVVGNEAGYRRLLQMCWYGRSDGGAAW